MFPLLQICAVTSVRDSTKHLKLANSTRRYFMMHPRGGWWYILSSTTMQFHGVYHEAPWSFISYLPQVQNSMVLHETPCMYLRWGPWKHHGTSWNTSRDGMALHEAPRERLSHEMINGDSCEDVVRHRDIFYARVRLREFLIRKFAWYFQPDISAFVGWQIIIRNK